MANAPAHQFYASNFTATTQIWEVEEVGIYIRLRCYQWVNGPMPNDEKRLARIAGCECELFKKAWVIVGSVFQKNEDGDVYDPEIEQIRSEQEAYREKQRLNGSRGGRPKKSETQTKPKQNPEVIENLNPEITPNTNLLYINNKEGQIPFFSIAGEIIQGNPSERINSEHTMATDKFMMTIFSGMDKVKILERLDLEYVGYQFKDEMHLRNSFKSVAEKMKLESKPKTTFQKQNTAPPEGDNGGFVIGQKPRGAVSHAK